MTPQPQTRTGALRRQFKELEVLHEVALMCVERTDEDSLIQGFTDLIGETFYPDNFGIFLLDEMTNELHPHPTYRLTGKAAAFPTISPGQGIIGQVAVSGQLFRADDVSETAEYLPGDPETRSELCVPLKAGERLIGVVNAESHLSQAFNEDDERLLVTLAGQLGTAIAHVRLFRETQRQNMEIAALYKAAIATSSILEVPALLENLAMQVQGLVRQDTFLVIRCDASMENFEMALVQDQGKRLRDLEGRRYSIKEGGLTGWVLRSRRTLFVPDILTAELPVEPEHINRPARSWIGVPMMVRNRLLGALVVQSYQPNFFDETHERFLESIASQFAVSLDNAELYTTARRNAGQLSILNDLAREMTGSVDLRELCTTFAKKLLETFEYYNVVVFLMDEAKTKLIPVGYAGAYVQYIEERDAHISLGHGIIGQAAFREKALVVNDTSTDPHFYELGGRHIRAELAIPLKIGDELLGILNVDSELLNAFDESAVALISTVGDQLSTAIEKARLFEETRQRAAHLEAQMQETQKRVQELTMLFDVSQSIAGAPPHDEEISRIIARQFAEVLGLKKCAIWMLKGESDSLTLLADYQISDGAGRFTHESRVKKIKLGDYPAIDQAIQHQEPLIVQRANSHANTNPPEQIQVDAGTNAMFIPVVIKSKSIGIIELDIEVKREYTSEDINLAMTLANQAAIALDNARLYDELEHSYVETVVGLAKAIDARDTYTGDHSRRMAQWSVAIAQRLGCSIKEIQAIRWASHLHDIGKIGVPDEILRKPGPLDEFEWEKMRKHPELGADIIAPFKQLTSVIPLIRAHQEKFDGTGYPDGLKGEDIPLGARILSVVDAYGAITDERVYRPARSHREAVVEITRCAGTHFDPDVVGAFLQVLSEE